MATNILNNGVDIEGTIEFTGDLQIDCKVTGEIKSTNGKLTLSPNSNIKGDIKAGAVDVLGKVDGSISAETCNLESSADVNGDLTYKVLGIQKGAKMVGSTKLL